MVLVIVTGIVAGTDFVLYKAMELAYCSLLGRIFIWLFHFGVLIFFVCK